MKKLLGVALVIVASACGSSSNTNQDTNVGVGTSNGNNTTTGNTNTTVSASGKITISGTLVELPNLTALQTADLNNITFVVADPAEVLANPNATPTILGTAKLDATTCTMTGCPFSISNVDVSSLSIGASIGVVPTVDTNTTLFPLYTGISQTQVLAGQAAGSLTGVYTFAVRVDGFTLLAAAAGSTAMGLDATGSLVGYVLDANLMPVSGASLVHTDWNVTVAYPGLDGNALLTTGGNLTATSSSGLFIAYPSTSAVSLGTNLSISDTDNLTYTVPAELGTTPGYSLMVVFVPNS